MSSASSLDEKRDVVIASVAEPLLLDDAEHKKLMRRVDWKVRRRFLLFPRCPPFPDHLCADSPLDLLDVLRRTYRCAKASSFSWTLLSYPAVPLIPYNVLLISRTDLRFALYRCR